MGKIVWIDVLKGLGILLVVVGHIWGGTLTALIYIFHMPLFFYISGYLLKPTVDYKLFLTHKAKSLLVPYLIYLIILYLIYYGFPDLTRKGLSSYFYKLVMGGKLLGGGLGIFWFVTCLFFTQQVVNYSLTKFKARTVMFIMLFFLALSYINSLWMPNFWLPWNLNVVLAAAPIYFIGFWFKNENISVNTLYILMGILLVIVFSLFFPANLYDMKNSYYGLPVITLISSLVFILGLKKFSQYISTIRIIEKPVSEIGRASMAIMFLHQPVQLIINKYISDDRVLRIFLAILIPYLLYVLFKKNKVTDALLLGNYRKFDVIQLLSKIKNSSS